MSQEGRRDTGLTPEVLDLVTRAQQDRERRAREKAEEEALKARKTKLRPHETERKKRQMSVTFPTPAWKQTLQDKADEWGLRPSDLLTYCLSYTMAAVESGKLEPPKGKGGRFYHRAAEFLDLPWEPTSGI
jgi:hypothetical protein